MKALYLLPLLFLSCKKEPVQTAETKKGTDSITSEKAVHHIMKRPIDILYDFDGDGKEDISGMVIKETGNRLTISFISKIPPLHLQNKHAIPVGEGDLNGDGAAELTLALEPNHGCVYDITTWSLQKGKWKQVFGPELFPTACESVNADSIDSLIVKENRNVYFYKADLNDEHFKKVKTLIELRN